MKSTAFPFNWSAWKRYGFLIGLTTLTLPLQSWLHMERSQSEAYAWLPLFIIFGVVPLLDWIIGSDRHNPEPEAFKPLEQDRWYTLLLLSVVPLQLALIFWGVGLYASPELSLWGKLGWMLSMGAVLSTAGITVAHELVHRKSPLESNAGGLLLASVCLGSFKVEHVRGHHQYVGTPEDASSAPLGRTVYSCILSAILSNFFKAWELEAQRLAKNGRSAWHWSNEVLGWSLASGGLLFLLVQQHGVWGGLGFLGQSLVATSLLEVVNYVEHYGLQRRALGNGRYEAVSAAHSWNSSALLTNLLLFHLQRHSDHHLYARRPYQVLRNHEASPQLPFGYGTMVPLALIPPLWFWIMNPQVEAVMQKHHATHPLPEAV